MFLATDYGLDGPGSNPGGGEIFRTCPDRPWGPPSLLCNRYRVLPRGKERPGRDADPSPPSSLQANHFQIAKTVLQHTLSLFCTDRVIYSDL